MFDTKKGLVSEVLMRRASHTGSILVVEGRDDVKFWRLRRHRTCRLVDGGGKPNVISSMSRLDTIRFEGVLAVVDSNYDHLAGTVLAASNIVLTDAHDLECLLCRSTALDAVLAEHGDENKIERFEGAHGSARTALLDRGVAFGCLRWAARQFEPSLGLAKVKPAQFIDQDTWQLDETRMVEAALRENSHVDEAALLDAISMLPAADPWYVARGHDMLEILRLGLRHVLGKLPNSVGVDQLATVLRQGMSTPELESTKMWRDMRDWEATNRPFLVLRE